MSTSRPTCCTGRRPAALAALAKVAQACGPDVPDRPFALGFRLLRTRDVVEEWRFAGAATARFDLATAFAHAIVGAKALRQLTLARRIRASTTGGVSGTGSAATAGSARALVVRPRLRIGVA